MKKTGKHNAAPHPFVTNVRESILKFGMLKGGERVLLAVSGGADSTAMLHALHALKDELGLKLAVCHLNHNLRGAESERDFNFVKKTAKGLGILFEGKKLKPGELKKLKGESLQAAAREKRYAFFEEAAGKRASDRVALGHTLDDQAETVLMRLIKGSGPEGLSGIPPVRDRFIRPLIETSREEVEGFLRDRKLGYIIDSSNLLPKYLRNDLRLNLIPLIRKKYNPNIIEALARAGFTLSEENDFLRTVAKEALSAAVLERKKDKLVLSRKTLLELHGAILSRVFFEAAALLERRGDVYGAHLDSFLKLVKGDNPGSAVDLPEGLKIFREYEKVIFTTAPAADRKPFGRALKVPGTTVIEEAGVSLKASVIRKAPSSFGSPDIVYFDYEKLPKPVMVRQFEPGDRMVPFGLSGHKKLKEIFIEKKVPKNERLAVPVLVAGNDVVWAAGIRQSEFYKIGKDTKRILRVELKRTG